jgi:hypothetical protein
MVPSLGHWVGHAIRTNKPLLLLLLVRATYIVPLPTDTCSRVFPVRVAWPRASQFSATRSHDLSPSLLCAMSDDGSQAVRDVADDDGYTWVHRLVLQSFLTHGVMTVDDLKPVLATIMTTHGIPNPRPSIYARRRLTLRQIPTAPSTQTTSPSPSSHPPSRPSMPKSSPTTSRSAPRSTNTTRYLPTPSSTKPPTPSPNSQPASPPPKSPTSAACSTTCSRPTTQPRAK